MSDKSAPKKRRRWIWWVVLAAVVLVVGFFVWRMSAGTTSDVNNYTTAQVAKQNLTVAASGSGNLVVGSAVSVDPGISGTVDDLSVKLGQTVEADDLLFRIVNSDLDAAVERAQVSYTQAEQGVTQAKISLSQARKNLYDLEHPSSEGTAPVKTPSEYDIKLAERQVVSAKQGLNVAYGNADTAATALSAAKADAAKRTVTAPVGGMITALDAQNGEQLGTSSSSSSGSSGSSSGGSSGSSAGGSSGGSTTSGSSTSGSAVEISNMDTLRASISINEVDLVNVKLGQMASVEFDALPSGAVSGTVTAISPTGTNSSGVITYNVDLKLTEIDPRLRPTMSCSADIVTEEVTGALVVPTSAIKTSNGSSYVQVLSVGATAPKQVTVMTGVVVGTRTQVKSGVKEGEYVVTGGSAGGSATTTSTTNGRGGLGGAGMLLGGGGPRN